MTDKEHVEKFTLEDPDGERMTFDLDHAVMVHSAWFAAVILDTIDHCQCDNCMTITSKLIASAILKDREIQRGKLN